MLYERMSPVRYLAVLLIVAVMILGGCAGNRQSLESEGVILKYRMPGNKVLKYRYDNTAKQDMNFQGQSFTIGWTGMDAVSIRPGGREPGGYELDVTFDSLDFKLTTPRGPIEPDMKSLHGKSFTMVLSPQGKESKITSDEPLEVVITPGETQDVTSTYKAFFPNLPTRAVTIGDTWMSRDTVTETGASSTRTIIIENNNRLDGFETIAGMRCARIVADVTGTIEGSGQENGIDLTTTGKISGTETWYFAVKEGLFVKTVSTGIGESTITGVNKPDMTIPVTRDYTIMAELLR